MRKRITLTVTAIVLFLMIAASAGAEGTQEQPPKLLWVADEETEMRWAEILGFQEPLKSLVVKQHYDSFVDLINDYQPDFFGTRTYLEETPKTLYKAGLIEPFTPTSAMLEEIASMSPLIQQVIRSELMTEDGKLLAYPAGWSFCYVPGFIGYWVPDAWAASPFRDITPPSSYEELLDFIEVFLDTPHEDFRLFYGRDGDKREYLYDLFRDNLLEGWVLRCKVSGKPVVFSDPKFIELAGRAQKLYKRLLKVDFKKKVNTNIRYLLAEHQNYGLSFNAKDTFTCANIIPLRMTADQPPLFNVTMTLQCVRKGSDYASYAPELFETDIPHVQINHGFEWYEEWAFPDKVDEKAENKYFDRPGTPKYDRITREWLDSVNDLQQYVVPCMEKTDWCIESQYGACMRAQQQFWVDGKLTAEEYAAEMDREWASAIGGANDVDMWIEDFPEDSD